MRIIYQWTLALGLLAAMASPSFAHFVYLLPDAPQSKVLAVFSDYLKPDGNVDIKKIEATQLRQIDAAGNETPIEWKISDHAYEITPSTQPSIVFGKTDYGVSSGRHSGNVPNRIYYYSKAVLGDFNQLSPQTLSKGDALTIVPLESGEQFRFRVLLKGQPVANAECHILSPNAEKSTAIKTNEEGIAQVDVTASGLYGIRVKVTEEKPGQLGDKSYANINHWATLVLNLSQPD